MANTAEGMDYTEYKRSKHIDTCALCALLALLALLVGLTPLLQCAKQAGKTVMRFISATIMTLVEGGRAVFNSMERVRLDKIK